MLVLANPRSQKRKRADSMSRSRVEIWGLAIGILQNLS
jgi:hypothetical protein